MAGVGPIVAVHSPRRPPRAARVEQARGRCRVAARSLRPRARAPQRSHHRRARVGSRLVATVRADRRCASSHCEGARRSCNQPSTDAICPSAPGSGKRLHTTPFRVLSNWPVTTANPSPTTRVSDSGERAIGLKSATSALQAASANRCCRPRRSRCCPTCSLSQLPSSSETRSHITARARARQTRAPSLRPGRPYPPDTRPAPCARPRRARACPPASSRRGTSYRSRIWRIGRENTGGILEPEPHGELRPGFATANKARQQRGCPSAERLTGLGAMRAR